MKTLKRIISVLAAASFLALAVTTATAPSQPAHAGCGSGVTWRGWSEINSSQAGGTHDWSSHSIQNSDDGQTFTDTQTLHKNADGSSTTHEESTYDDPFGNGCNSGGAPMKATRTRDTEQDSEGNGKETIREYVEEGGKCFEYVWERQWRRGSPTGPFELKSKTEVPCHNQYSLQVSWEGNYTPPNGGVTATYGPDTALIPLRLKDGIYTGSYKGQFQAQVTGTCNATGAVPVTYEVNAKEDKSEVLEFTVTRTFYFSWNTVCPGLSGASTTPLQTRTDTFTLLAEDGASKTVDSGNPGPVTTYTLKKRSP